MGHILHIGNRVDYRSSFTVATVGNLGSGSLLSYLPHSRIHLRLLRCETIVAPKPNSFQFRFLVIGQGGLQHEVYVECL